MLSVVAGLALLISALPPGTLPSISVCWFKNQTGFPCPGCGLTRSFVAISHGDLPAAWHFNPFGFFFYALSIALAAWPLLAWRFPKLAGWQPAGRRATWFALGMVAAMWIFGLCRMYAGSDI
ncbi:MAG: DUF2752 domain-containing protein [Planctomycetota bacterium]|nr:DUF2752 domain-containing protein [Planctomycetota bacterium]